MKPDESSMEFDMFEELRQTLTQFFADEGRDAVEAERIAFYVVQGIREVPKLMAALVRTGTPPTKIRETLAAVLDNASALEKARALLLGIDDKIVH